MLPPSLRSPLLTLSLLVPWAAPAVGQFDFALDKATAGRLGQPLQLDVAGAPPLSLLLLVPSLSAGPTPLWLIDPGDLRVLAVGAELLGSSSLLLASPLGATSYALPLPNSVALHGGVLHWQAVQVTLATPFFGALGNDVVTQFGLPDTGVLAPAQLMTARAFAAGFLDVDNNPGMSDVVIAGGGSGTLTNATGVATSEVWDFRRMRRQPGPTMGSARALHLAVPLTDGRVLIIGGANATGATLTSCEIYNPATNSFSPTGSMATPRVLHAACRLADGRVMVAGGTSTLQPDVLAALAGSLNSVEIWNPTTGTWSAAAPIGGARLAPALTLLPNGQVMVSGGVQYTTILGIPNAATTTAVQRWSPATGTWVSGPNMAQSRAGHHYNQVALADGRILVTGGVAFANILAAATAAPIAGAEIFNPATTTWSTANMPTARALHTATLLPDGRVVVCGGAQGTLTTPVPIAAVDVFQPATNTWASAPALTAPRASHVALLLRDRTLVLFGGQDAAATTTTIETLRF